MENSILFRCCSWNVSCLRFLRETDLLLLDEPLVNLDFKLRERLRELLAGTTKHEISGMLVEGKNIRRIQVALRIPHGQRGQ